MKTLLQLLLLLVLNIQTSKAQTAMGALLDDDEKYNGLAANLPSKPVSSFPQKIDLSDKLPPVGNQGDQQSCVAWAISYAAYSYHMQKVDVNWRLKTHSGLPNYAKIFSPSYLYNQINGGKDEGSNYSNALDFIKANGICTWQSMPYYENNYLHQPSKDAKNEAQNFKIDSYRRLGAEYQSLEYDVKEQLSNGNPVIASAISDQNYLGNGRYHNNSSNLYIWNSVGPHNPNFGHAILLVGYDDGLKAFNFLNSYGPNWGNNGYGWISYHVFNGVINRCYTIKIGKLSNNTNDEIIYENRNNLNNADVNIGLNLVVGAVEHMNTITHPGVPLDKMFMTVKGRVSVPNNSGSNVQIIIYYYFIDQFNRRIPLLSNRNDFKLPSGQAISFTHPLPLTGAIISREWKSEIPYHAFPRGYNPPYSFTPITYVIEAEPALLIDNYPVRIGQSFRFPVTH